VNPSLTETKFGVSNRSPCHFLPPPFSSILFLTPPFFLNPPSWPGILMITTWSVDVVGHFFLVFFILILLSSQTAFKTDDTWEVSVCDNLRLQMLLPPPHPLPLAPHPHPNTYSLQYKTFMNIFVGTLLPACLAWSFTGTAMARRRVKQSGEDGEQLA
jgi:hypothetical protein